MLEFVQQRAGTRYNAQNVQELLRQAGAYQQQPHQQSPDQQQQQHQKGRRRSISNGAIDGVVRAESSMHASGAASSNNFGSGSQHQGNSSSSGGVGSAGSRRPSKSSQSHTGKEYRRPERLLDLQELADAQPECPIVAPKYARAVQPSSDVVCFVCFMADLLCVRTRFLKMLSGFGYGKASWGSTARRGSRSAARTGFARTPTRYAEVSTTSETRRSLPYSTGMETLAERLHAHAPSRQGLLMHCSPLIARALC